MDIRKEEAALSGEPVYSAEFRSDAGEKNRVLGVLLDELRKNDLISEEDLFSIRLVLDEGLVNAVKHGNGNDPEKSVTVSLYIEQDTWIVMIKDEGDGFSEEKVPSLDDEDSLLMNHGRGVNLMKHFMDEVTYYCNGRILVLKKKCK